MTSGYLDKAKLARIRERLDTLYPSTWPLLLVLVCGPNCTWHACRERESHGKGPHPDGKGWNDRAMQRLDEAGTLGTGEFQQVRDVALDRAAAHVAAGGNLGLCVPPGLIVLDCDTDEAHKWVRRYARGAPWQRTRSGSHTWLRLPPDLAGRGLKATTGFEIEPGLKVDLRTAAHSQLVVEPSQHRSDFGYQFKRRLPAAPHDIPMVPERWVGALEQSARRGGSAGRPTRTAAQWQRLMEQGAVEGGRNDFGVTVAGKVIHHLLEDTLDALSDGFWLAFTAAAIRGACEPLMDRAEAADIVSRILDKELGAAPEIAAGILDEALGKP